MLSKFRLEYTLKGGDEISLVSSRSLQGAPVGRELWRAGTTHPALATTCWAGVRPTRDKGSFEHPVAPLPTALGGSLVRREQGSRGPHGP